MCGVIGIVGTTSVAQSLYNGLLLLQHRGQDAAGIVTGNDEGQIFTRRSLGLVRDVFQQRHMERFEGNMGIGHLRYPTAGTPSANEAQPFYVNSPFGIALGHNGNLTNAEELRVELFKQDLRQLNTSSDSEILLNIFAHELREAVGDSRLRASPQDIFRAVSGVFRRCRGAYSVVAMVVGVGIVAFRDPCGIRPLVYGTRETGSGTSHMFASESVALDVLGYDRVGDVGAGETVLIDIEGRAHRAVCGKESVRAPCIFEYVYLARPDSIIDDIPVYQTRIHMGERLGNKLRQEWPDHDIDVVIPVPDTSRTSALEMARVLELPYREGFIKNRYIGRTFIMPGQLERKKSVRQKLNAIESEFFGKNVLLVDDSIVRGTTSQKIIELAREAGAKKVYFASAAPPVRFANVYGIDMPSRTELVASDRDTDAVCAEIGADRLIYQELDDLVQAVRACNPDIGSVDTSCFDGQYITGDITNDYLNSVDTKRNDGAKQESKSELDLSEITDVHQSPV